VNCEAPGCDTVFCPDYGRTGGNGCPQRYCSVTCRRRAQRHRQRYVRSPSGLRRQLEFWACSRKQLRFASEAAALEQMQVINDDPGSWNEQPLRSAYRCRYGDHWHLTHLVEGEFEERLSPSPGDAG
jgi:hypothetical protein